MQLGMQVEETECRCVDDSSDEKRNRPTKSCLDCRLGFSTVELVLVKDCAVGSVGQGNRVQVR